MENNLEQKEFLKEIFKEVIHEVIIEERISFYDSIFPVASEKEMAEIESIYGEPENIKNEELVDMTDWVLNAD